MATQVVILRFRAELCLALGEIEKCHEGIFQQVVRLTRPERWVAVPRAARLVGLTLERPGIHTEMGRSCWPASAVR